MPNGMGFFVLPSRNSPAACHPSPDREGVVKAWSHTPLRSRLGFFGAQSRRIRRVAALKADAWRRLDTLTKADELRARGSHEDEAERPALCQQEHRLGCSRGGTCLEWWRGMANRPSAQEVHYGYRP